MFSTVVPVGGCGKAEGFGCRIYSLELESLWAGVKVYSCLGLGGSKFEFCGGVDLVRWGLRDESLKPQTEING